MAKQGGPVIFEKTFGIVSLYKRCGIGLARCKSNLTAERWRNDPAFAGSRNSAAEMGTAATIAAPFYKALPQGLRIFSLYHQFVGLAKKLLSAGMPVAGIEETLALAVIRLRKMELVGKQKQASPKKARQKQSQGTSAPSSIVLPAFLRHIKIAAPSVKALPLQKMLPLSHAGPHKYLHRRTRGRSALAAALL